MSSETLKPNDVNIETSEVLTALINALDGCLIFSGNRLNEHYLHHRFTGLLGPWQVDGEPLVHPEWPTYKKGSGISYSRYRKTGRFYQPDDSGTSAHIDFAIGPYAKPKIGIELTVKYGWSNEEIVYDFLKLLDRANPFSVAVSLNVLLRRKLVTRGLADLENHIHAALDEAKRRLGARICGVERRVFFVICEFSSTERRYWVVDSVTSRFVQMDRIDLSAWN